MPGAGVEEGVRERSGKDDCGVCAFNRARLIGACRCTYSCFALSSAEIITAHLYFFYAFERRRTGYISTALSFHRSAQVALKAVVGLFGHPHARCKNTTAVSPESPVYPHVTSTPE